MIRRNHDGWPAGYREPQTAKALPKRFYVDVSVGEDGGSYRIQLDGRSVRTPGKKVLAVPSRSLAEAVAAEWRAQDAVIDPAMMPLTRILNSALDGVAGREAEVVADVVKYAGSDLVCYRSDHPAELIARQQRYWDPVLDWARSELDCRFVLSQGVMPVQQSSDMLARFGAQVEGWDALRLAALHVMTTLLGSALLALGHARGRLTGDDAWRAAHVDEDFQIEQWGEDPEASERRRFRLSEFRAASLIVRMLSKR